jgi:hypothetical protein
MAILRMRPGILNLARWNRVPVTRHRPALRPWTPLVAALALCFAVPAAAQQSREYDLKAVFLYNFASFVEWPKSSFVSADSPFIIGILGHDPFGKSLNDVVAGERVHGHPIVVRRYAEVAQVRAQPPHILFISASEAERIELIVKQLQGLPILTVSEVPGFLRAGGAINFTTSNRVQLRINPDATQTAGLSVSSKLLRLAQTSTGGSTP